MEDTGNFKNKNTNNEHNRVKGNSGGDFSTTNLKKMLSRRDGIWFETKGKKAASLAKELNVELFRLGE